MLAQVALSANVLQLQERVSNSTEKQLSQNSPAPHFKDEDSN